MKKVTKNLQGRKNPLKIGYGKKVKENCFENGWKNNTVDNNDKDNNIVM